MQSKKVFLSLVSIILVGASCLGFSASNPSLKYTPVGMISMPAAGNGVNISVSEVDDNYLVYAPDTVTAGSTLPYSIFLKGLGAPNETIAVLTAKSVGMGKICQFVLGTDANNHYVVTIANPSTCNAAISGTNINFSA